MGAPAARVSELAGYWGAAGHQVTVLTGFPNHPDGVLRREYRRHFRRLVYREHIDGVNVVRTWLLPFPNRKAYERMLNYASFCLSAAVTGSCLKHSDVVIATSPQLLVGLSGWWVARFKRVPFILEVRDLWPESLAAVGVGDQDSILHRVLSKIAGFLYRHADHIVVVTKAFREQLKEKWSVPNAKISLAPNGVETKLFRPHEGTSLRQELGIGGKFVVSYIGTLGLAHRLDTLIEAAEALQQVEPEVAFVLLGEGADRERILARAKTTRLANIHFVPQQPRAKIPDYIAASDACLVLLKKSTVFETVIPSKMLEFMSCSRPVILGVSGEAREILEHARAGICVEPENATALANAIQVLKHQPVLCNALGRNGREYIIKNLSRERTAADYLDVIHGLLGIKARERARAAA